MRAAVSLLLLAACAPRPDGYPVGQLQIGHSLASCRAQSCCYPWDDRAGSVSTCVRLEVPEINGAEGVIFYVRGKKQ